MKKTSILMVVAEYPPTHGHNTVINNLCIGLEKIGFKTSIGAFSFLEDPPFGIEKIKLSKSKLLRYGVKYLNFDIIHSHQPRVNYYLLCKRPSKPVLFHYHGPSSLIHKINFKLSMKLHGKRLSKVIAVSETAAKQMYKLIGHFPTEIIYNGVDLETYNQNLPQPYRKGNPQLLFVSALRTYKNTDLLIKMMPELLNKYPESHLQIVGSGEEHKKLESIIERKNLKKNIELVGEITKTKELALRYSSCDLYVSASSLEACPASPFEAMACGRPLVLSKINAHEEIISISNAGFDFSLSNKSEIVTKIIEAYEQKDILSKNAGCFAQEHDWKSTCKQLAQIYDNLLFNKN